MSGYLKKIRIGTRGSPLALTQTAMVCAALAQAHPGLEVETVVIKTTGDWAPADGEVRLEVQAGGKASFAKEIEEALLADAIDAAVHSMKDMETFLPEGLVIPCMLPREDARDALLFSDDLRGAGGLEDLPKGAVVGSASVRRQAFLLNKRPDLKVVPLRGNVQTRIDKVRSGQVDVTLLAMAGLNRLGLSHEMDAVLEVEEMLPSAGQGAVGIEVRANDNNILAIFSQLNCEETLLRVSAERVALGVLNGSCHTPIGAHAVFEDGMMSLRVAVAALDGSEIYEEAMEQEVSTVEEAEALGQSLGQKLKSKVPAKILEQYAG